MVAKPAHVFDRDEDWRALVSFAQDPRSHASLGVVSGRRRQGKTYLLSTLADALDGFYFEAAEATEADSLRMFGCSQRRVTTPARPRWSAMAVPASPRSWRPVPGQTGWS